MIDTFTRFYVGHVLDVLADLPDGSIDLVMTSPPFLALRSYLPAGDPLKHLEIGSESTPGQFLDVLLDVVEALEPKLAPHGSMCIELGDTFAGSGGAGGDYDEGGLHDGQERFDGSARRGAGRVKTAGHASSIPGRKHYTVPKANTQAPRSGAPKYQGRENHAPTRDADEAAGIIPARSHSRRERDGWPLNKSLCLIPELFRFALVYGFNPLTGRETPRWRARNVVRWVRPNPPVGALADKFRPGVSEMVVVCKSDARYFDLDAVRTPSPRIDNHRASATQYAVPGQPERRTRAIDGNGDRIHANEAGAPPLDWWCIPGRPYKGAHYATFPEELCRRPVLAMSPIKVCTTCGKPSQRITAKTPEYEAFRSSRSATTDEKTDLQRARHLADKGGVGSIDHHDDAGARGQLYLTVGWTECGCGEGCRPTTWKTEITEVAQGRHWPTKSWLDLDEWPDDTEPAQLRTKRKRKKVIDDLGHHDPRCDHWRAGVVLDPFAGSGTTLVVAIGNGRSSIGIDLDARNVDLARDRIGMWLEVVDRRERPKEATA